MSYAPTTDFVALLRQTTDGVELARMPGLDYVLAAMARAGIFRLWTEQAPPTANQSTTVWLKPANPSWTAEGSVFLWNADTQQFEAATPELWRTLFTGL